MGDARETLLSVPNYNTPVKDLAYKDLLTSTFTLVSHRVVSKKKKLPWLFGIRPSGRLLDASSGNEG
jgi:hypothetical protein